MKQKKKAVLILFTSVVLLIAGCKRQDEFHLPFLPGHGHLSPTNSYTSEVAFAWMDMQLQLMKTATGIPNNAFCRPYAYTGIALYESVVPGMPGYQTFEGRLNGLSGLPVISPGLNYHWPSAANAALAYMNRMMFPTTSAANKTSIDSLENALVLQYQNKADAATISRSIAFGKAVAQKIFAWSETDGYLHASDPYTPPAGPGLWVPTPPAFAAASTPYWGKLRTIVPGSTDNTQPGAPMPYSTDPSSGFYKMVKQVYDVSTTLTADQTAQALYWRDVPGVTTPGHYLSILKQVLQGEKAALDKTAFAYAFCAIAVNDAAISCWQTKYTYNQVRPITYIRNVLGFTSWVSLLTTPAHPEYSSAHAVLSAANAEALTSIFGDNYHFTDHTYDYLGFPARTFASFRAIAIDAGNSRLYAGIHYQPSVDTGLIQGKKVEKNIENRCRFFKND